MKTVLFLNTDDDGSLGNADQQQGDVLTTSSDVMMIAVPLAIAGVVVAGGKNILGLTITLSITGKAAYKT